LLAARRTCAAFGRPRSALDIAQAVPFPAGDGASFVTGFDLQWTAAA
jgi:hypothetical protein